MLLAKNCYAKDNLKTGKTIKLGTLFEYRETESAQIVDDGEGRHSFILNLDGVVEIDPQWFNLIFQGLICLGDHKHHPQILGSMTAHINKLEIVNSCALNKHNEQVVIVKDSSASIHREALNGFIFCMSRVRKMRDAVGLFPDYDDCWYMTASKAHSLGIALSKLLRERIIAGRQSGDHIVASHVSLDNLSIYCRHEPVSYFNREVHISDATEFTADHFMQKISDMAFVKPPSFSTEKEYRFSFTIVANGFVVTPAVDYVILDAEQLVDWTV